MYYFFFAAQNRNFGTVCLRSEVSISFISKSTNHPGFHVRSMREMKYDSGAFFCHPRWWNTVVSPPLWRAVIYIDFRVRNGGVNKFFSESSLHWYPLCFFIPRVLSRFCSYPCETLTFHNEKAKYKFEKKFCTTKKKINLNRKWAWKYSHKKCVRTEK